MRTVGHKVYYILIVGFFFNRNSFNGLQKLLPLVFDKVNKMNIESFFLNR
jgi:hypothetical protein